MMVTWHDVSGKIASNDGSKIMCKVQFEAVCASDEYKRLMSMLADGKIDLKEGEE